MIPSTKEEKHMREAKFIKSVTAAITPELYNQIKKITDGKKISMGEWFREAATRALANARNREEPNDDR